MSGILVRAHYMLYVVFLVFYCISINSSTLLEGVIKRYFQVSIIEPWKVLLSHATNFFLMTMLVIICSNYFRPFDRGRHRIVLQICLQF